MYGSNAPRGCPTPSSPRSCPPARGAPRAPSSDTAYPLVPRELVDVERAAGRTRLRRRRSGRAARARRAGSTAARSPRPRRRPPRRRPQRERRCRPSSEHRSERRPEAAPPMRRGSAAGRAGARRPRTGLLRRSSRTPARPSSPPSARKSQATGRRRVEVAPTFGQRRDGRGERTVEHAVTLRSRTVSALRVERDGEILRITLTRPETRNAFDAALIAELAEAFVDVGKARAVVLAGDGPASAPARTSTGCGNPSTSTTTRTSRTRTPCG